MTARTVLIKELDCDNCGETLRSTEPSVGGAIKQAAAIGWAHQPKRGTTFAPDFRPARDLCSTCKLIEEAA
ncbi:hypothetical protein QNA23_10520 [Rhodococcus erythropolis]|uniref:hypothetical protein n=1 Tax=Rhodococcus erythropolis TaxID=1833 RepID=UPI0024BA7FA8|nr:hypothetical protein [Rhodococcus erythropolis]MDJ0403915.1 hypothetical protein [Rhodococcus erythropolis]